MSKKIFTLLIIFFIIFSFLISVGIFYIIQTFPKKEQIKQNHLIQKNKSILTILPQTLTIQNKNKIQTANIYLTNGTDLPEIIQLELVYNPNIIYNVTLSPADYFTNPTILFQNQKLGKIILALEKSKQDTIQKQSGNVATISFMINSNIQAQKTTISFFPKTIIKDKENNNILQEAFGTEIIIN